MKIRDNIPFKLLEDYGYRYKENAALPTYSKVKQVGYMTIYIDILMMNRTIYINKSDHITERNVRFIKDLIQNNVVEK